MSKLDRQQYLMDVLEKYTKTQPSLSVHEIAEVLYQCFDGEIVDLLKELRREIKKG